MFDARVLAADDEPLRPVDASGSSEVFSSGRVEVPSQFPRV